MLFFRTEKKKLACSRAGTKFWHRFSVRVATYSHINLPGRATYTTILPIVSAKQTHRAAWTIMQWLCIQVVFVKFCNSLAIDTCSTTSFLEYGGVRFGSWSLCQQAPMVRKHFLLDGQRWHLTVGGIWIGGLLQVIYLFIWQIVMKC